MATPFDAALFGSMMSPFPTLDPWQAIIAGGMGRMGDPSQPGFAPPPAGPLTPAGPEDAGGPIPNQFTPVTPVQPPPQAPPVPPVPQGIPGVGFGGQFQPPMGGFQPPTTTVPPMPGDRAGVGRQIYQFFLGRGLQPHQAAALAGNFAWEGGGRWDQVNPNDNVRGSPNSPHSAGLGQWNDRLPALIAFARQQGISVPEGDLRDVSYVRRAIASIPLETQLGFAWQELQTSERGAFDAIMAGQDVSSATGGAIGYFRPAGWTRSNPMGGHGFQGRLSLASEILRGTGPFADNQQTFTPTGYTPGTGGIPQAETLPYTAFAGQPPTGMGPMAPPGPPRPSTTVSPQASALVPGMGPPQGVARSGIMGLFDLAGIGRAEPAQQSPADYFAHFSTNQQNAAAQVFQRGQQMRLEHPDASPDQLYRLMLRDPIWGRHAITLGTLAPQVLRSAVTPPPPPPGSIVAPPPGVNARDIGTGQVVASGGPPTPPDQQRLLEWILTLPPQVQQQVLPFLRSQPPMSDREQAQSRIDDAVRRGVAPSIGDLNLAGYLRPVNTPYGERTYDMFNQRYLTPDEQGRIAPPMPIAGPVPGGPPLGPLAGPPPPVGGAGPPVPPVGGLASATITPGPAGTGIDFARPDDLNLFGAGNFRPPFDVTSPGLVQQEPPSQALDTTPRRIRVTGRAPFTDAPGLAVSSTLMDDPAEMFFGTGPVAAFRSAIGRVGANFIPGFQANAQTRSAMIDRLTASIARWQEGTRLAGEHDTQMRAMAQSGDWTTNPERALTQGILAREEMIRNLEIAMQQQADTSLPESTRTIASTRVARAQEVLRSLPTLEAMITLLDRVRRGETVGDTSVPGVSELMGAAGRVYDSVTGAPPTGETPPTTTPDSPQVGEGRIPDAEALRGLTMERLMELSRQPNVPRDGLVRIRDEIARRQGSGPLSYQTGGGF